MSPYESSGVLVSTAAASQQGAARHGYGLPAATNESGVGDLVSAVLAAGPNENGGAFTASEQDAAHRGYGLPPVANADHNNGAGYLDHHMPAASMNPRGTQAPRGFSAASGGGEKQVLFYKARTPGAATDHLPPVVVLLLPGGKAAVIGRAKDDAALAERMRGGLPVVGLAVASVAATGLAAGAVTPVTGFSMLLMLLASLSLVTIHVLRA